MCRCGTRETTRHVTNSMPSCPSDSGCGLWERGWPLSRDGAQFGGNHSRGSKLCHYRWCSTTLQSHTMGVSVRQRKLLGGVIRAATCLPKSRKASQPSLLVLPSWFRGHLLHSILSRLLHFPMTYPEVPETWSLYSILINVYNSYPSFNFAWKIPGAFPEEMAPETLKWKSSRLWN